MEKPEVYLDVLRMMERTLRALEHAVPPPTFVEIEPGYKSFRYVERLPIQAVVAKLARIGTALHSAGLLVQAGFLQDTGAIQRVLDELHEDVAFLCHAIIDGDFTPNHHKFLAEFWQEELEGMGTPKMRNVPRHRVPREIIRAYLANHATNSLDQSKTLHAAKLIGKSYSGYVHGAGSHIMEMYGGSPPRFHIGGMRGTRLWKAQCEDLNNYLHRSVNTFALAALALGDAQLANGILRFRARLEEALAMDHFDEINKHMARKKSKRR